MNNKYIKKSISTSIYIGFPIGLFFILLVSGALLIGGLLTGLFMKVALPMLPFLIIAFYFSLRFAGRKAHLNLRNKQSLRLTSFKYSLSVNLIIWLVVLGYILFVSGPVFFYGLSLVLIVITLLCTIGTAATLGYVICKKIKVNADMDDSDALMRADVSSIISQPETTHLTKKQFELFNAVYKVSIIVLILAFGCVSIFSLMYSSISIFFYFTIYVVSWPLALWLCLFLFKLFRDDDFTRHEQSEVVLPNSQKRELIPSKWNKILVLIIVFSLITILVLMAFSIIMKDLLFFSLFILIYILFPASCIWLVNFFYTSK